MASYEKVVQDVQDILCTGCFWGEPRHTYLWKYCLERIANRYRDLGQPRGGTDAGQYPSMLLMYSAGLAAMANRNAASLRAILLDSRVALYRDERPAAFVLCTFRVIGGKEMNQILNKNFYTPVSEYLFSVLGPVLSDIIPRKLDFEASFDLFERLIALVYGDIALKDGESFRAPPGRFAWKKSEILSKDPARFDGDLTRRLLNAGFFDGSEERFNELDTALDRFIQGLNYS